MSAAPQPRPVSRTAAAIAVLITIAVIAALIAGFNQLLAATQHQPRPVDVDRLAQRLTLINGVCPEPPDRHTGPVSVTATLLIECPRLLGNQPVAYRGEAVRAIIDQGQHAWLHVNDGPYALERGPLPAHRRPAGTNSGIAVRIPASQASRIDTLGDARHHGTIIDITGTWQTSNPTDAGGPAIRAHHVEVVRPGHRLGPPRSPLRTWTAAITALLAAALTAVAWRRR